MATIFVFGSLNVDFVTQVERLPRPGETVLGPGFALHPGGKGANQALAAARCGADVRLFGAVGDDALAGEALVLLKPAGVDLSGIAVHPGPTGAAFIAVAADGANQIVVAAGANMKASADMIGKADIKAGDILLVQREVPESEIIRAARVFKAKGGRVILNAAPAGVPGPELMALLDVLVVNEHEARLIGEGLDLSGKDPVKITKRINDQHRIACIVTLGEGGATGFWDGIERHIGAPAVHVVDTTAAGDAFLGGFAAALAKGYGFTGALQRGVAAGSLTCTKAGAQSSLPFGDAVEACVTRQSG
jgi:ribokinase